MNLLSAPLEVSGAGGSLHLLTRPSSFRACGKRACRGYGCFPTISPIGYASTTKLRGRRTSALARQKIR